MFHFAMNIANKCSNYLKYFISDCLELNESHLSCTPISFWTLVGAPPPPGGIGYKSSI